MRNPVKFLMIPIEVFELLRDMQSASRDIYLSIIAYQIIEEDRSEEVWVKGKLRSNYKDIWSMAGISESSFYKGAWQDLINKKLIVENGDGSLTLTMLRRHKDTLISASEVKAMQSEILDLQHKVEDLTVKFTGKTVKFTGKTVKNTGNFSRHPYYEDNIGPEGPASARARAREEIGSKTWLVDQLNHLWPPVGVRLKDEIFVDQMLKFPPGDVLKVLAAAKNRKISRGNFNCLLDWLDNPERMEQKPRKHFWSREKHIEREKMDWPEVKQEVITDEEWEKYKKEHPEINFGDDKDDKDE